MCLGVSWDEAQDDIYWRRSGRFDENREKIREVLWDLLFVRVISPGINEKTENNANLPWFRLTNYGRVVVKEREIQPYDPDGYLDLVRREIPELDEEIERYLAESLQALRRDLPLSSAVTLGAASEKAFILLHESLTNALKDPEKIDRFTKLQHEIGTNSKFNKVNQEILSHKKKMPPIVKENLNTYLNTIFNVIRVTRNEAGHPTGKTPPRDTTFVNLRLFLPYCKKVYQLIEWLQSNPL